MELVVGFGHEFVDFLVDEFMLVVAEYFLELRVAIANCGKGHLASLDTDKGQVLILTHLYQVTGVFF